MLQQLTATAAELHDKVCLLAGASGAIGSAIAHRFRQEGAHLALTCHAAKPEWVCEELPVFRGRSAFYQLDVTDWGQVEAVVRLVNADFGGVDVLINCTGIIGPIGSFETLDMQEWVRTIETNLMGSVYLTRAVVPLMKKRGRGKIIFFSGGGAAYGRPFFTSYSCSKAALVRFAESLAQEVKGFSIQVNCVAPGPVKSRMWDELRAAVHAGGPQALAELEKMEATGGISAERAAALVLFLASNRSNGLTGRLISAVYDKWEDLEPRIPDIMSSDAGTLRRVPLE